MLEIIEAYLSSINKDLAVFVISMFPIVELRGAIPFGIEVLNMSWLRVFILSVIGNMLPMPFVILIIRPLIDWLLKTKMFAKFGKWLEERTKEKSKSVTKYKKLGLLIFVAIPLPGTGGWTGATVAGILNMRLKDALPVIFAGVVIAGILMMGITYGFGFLLRL